MLAFVIGVVIIALGLAVSIGLHEIGHLVPAKLFGVKVTQYMIGFGPTIWSRRKGETEYGVKAIPLGGYIAMIGMFPPARGERVHEDSTGFFRGLVQDARDSSMESITPGDEDRAFYRLPVWKRIIVMLGGHVVKTGIGPVLVDLMKRGVITHLAMNGSAAIHDYEIARFGGTSEDVAAGLKDGSFGMAEETGRGLNDAFVAGQQHGWGMGESVARALEGMKLQTSLGEVEMRADNHQILQPLYVSTLERGQKYDAEGTGLGWKTDAKVEGKATALPTTCKMERPR